MTDIPKQESEHADVTEAGFVVVWDPDILSEEEYANLVKAIGDVIRTHGGIGVRLLEQNTFEASVEEGAMI
jgi:hypothetical protein